ncbi:PfkB family carbohydrate kinase [Saccharospirillum salsuginis]|uniref:Fructosamine kinase FrlD n=1 Tax=Saccharospirillum salsuginis TaxID=418750 RepID=A0A918N6T2_9GAMM|nr:PfkB family carbohydrate kinase [Saccharospirillum salsuginis]GGX40893.1 fructosamine kinase FrlD [Saccharospirillum salsuginis]
MKDLNGSKYTLIGVGDNVVDNYVDQNLFYPGGNALNVAVLAKRYGLDRVGYMGIIGNDREGEHIQASLIKESLDVSRLRVAHGDSGKAYVSLNESGDRVFGQSNKGGVQSQLKLNFNQSDLDYIERFGLLHTSAYSYLDSELEVLSRCISLSYDFSTFKDVDRLDRVCPFITYGFFSCSEMSHSQAIRFAEHIRDRGVAHILLTRGDQGAIYLGDEGVLTQSIEAVNALDTLGAGDSYIAGFLASRIMGASAAESMAFGAKAAATTCLHYGAFGYPHEMTDYAASCG